MSAAAVNAEAALAEIGRSLLGPAFCHYVAAAITRSEALRVDRLYFLAREGYLLEQIFQVIHPRVGARPAPATSYLRVSRRATAPEADRALLERYLAAAGLFSGGRAALLDVGWSGTMQDHLVAAFGDRPGFPALHGLYLGLYPVARRDARLDASKEGLLYDGRRRTLTEWAPQHFVEIFENAARAPEGMTIGYRERAGVVEAVLQDQDGAGRACEAEAEPALATLRAAILACARDYQRVDPEAHKRCLERFIFLPTAAERAAVALLTHADDWTLVGHGRLLEPARPWLLLRPDRWVRRFYQARWKPGLIAETGGAPLCHLYRAYERYQLRSRWAKL